MEVIYPSEFFFSDLFKTLAKCMGLYTNVYHLLFKKPVRVCGGNRNKDQLHLRNF